METTESCLFCEKIRITVESLKPLDMLLELPNTFDPISKKYTWRHHDFMTYALIPREAYGITGIIDLFVCIDEDDLDDISLAEYADQFLHAHIFASWKNFKCAHLMQPCLSSPAELACWKVHHQPFANEM